MKISRIVYLLIIVVMIFSSFGCDESKVNQNETGTEYSLVYFDYVDGMFFEKEVFLKTDNIEEELVQTLLSKKNLPEDMYKQIGFENLNLESVIYDSESKSIELYFNEHLYDLENNSNVLISLISCISRTLEKLETVDFVNYYVDGNFIEGIGEIQISGELFNSNDE